MIILLADHIINMFIKFKEIAALSGLLYCFSMPVLAHTPLFDCFDNQDGTITCEAGFSDGASAEGVMVQVVNVQGKVLQQGRISSSNNITFQRPEEQYSVVFAAGEGHEIRVFGDDIY